MLLEKDREAIERACRELKSMGYDCVVSVDDFINYLKSPVYEEDIYRLEDILGNKYLLYHELLEISFLKKLGYSIDYSIIRRAYPDTYRAHLEAIDKELEIALKNRDYSWISRRLKDLESYLQDPFLPKILIDRVYSLIHKYSSMARR